METENTLLLKKILRPKENVPVVLNARIKIAFLSKGPVF